VEQVASLGTNLLVVSLVGATAFLFAFAVGSRVVSELFAIYRANFLRSVDKGLRDVVLVVDPGQLLIITLVAAAIVGPIIYLFFNVFFAAAVVVAVMFLPGRVLKLMKQQRSDKFAQQLPDALAAMAASLRAGLNLSKAFQQVVKNQPAPISQEFAQVLVEYRVGNDLNDSLDDMCKRIGKQELVLMNSAIKISRTIGGNLADTFDALANTLREKMKVEGKIRSITSMGRSQAIMATFFPIGIGLVFAKMEPVAMTKLFTTPLGLMFVGVMAGMMMMARLLIKRVVADGWDIAKATAEAEAIGLTSAPLKQFAIEYATAHKKK